MTPARVFFPVRRTLFFVGLMLLGAGALHAQQRPQAVPFTSAITAPTRYISRLEVTHGTERYFGTATYIRRLVALTAAHLLFDPATGYSTHLDFQAYDEPRVSYFATLSGYQDATGGGRASQAAFDLDMGYLLLTYSDLEVGADWAAAPDRLATSGPFLLYGFAAQQFSGQELAFVRHQTPYTQKLTALFENTGYWSEEGMSGGPVFDLAGNTNTLVAINVGGTTYPQTALSAARAITPAEAAIFTSAEYDHGLITGGVITGPATVAAGAIVKYKTGVAFYDHFAETVSFPVRYDDVKLVAGGPYKSSVSITKNKPGVYHVQFAADLPSGAQVPLNLFRTARPQRSQTALKTMVVTVQ